MEYSRSGYDLFDTDVPGYLRRGDKQPGWVLLALGYQPRSGTPTGWEARYHTSGTAAVADYEATVTRVEHAAVVLVGVAEDGTVVICRQCLGACSTRRTYGGRAVWRWSAAVVLARTLVDARRDGLMTTSAREDVTPPAEAAAAAQAVADHVARTEAEIERCYGDGVGNLAARLRTVIDPTKPEGQ